MFFNHERHSGKLLVTCVILFLLMLAFLIAFIVEVTKNNGEKSRQTSDDRFTVVCNTTACQASGKFILESIDHSVDPCDDFYEYACGNWRKKNPIPNSLGQYGILQTVGSKINDKVKGLLNQTSPSTTTAEDKAKLFYKSCMYADDTVEKNAMKKIKEFLAELGGWPLTMDNWVDRGKWSWWEVVAKVKNNIGMDVILGAAVAPHILDTSKYRIYLQIPLPEQLQDGLMSMPHFVFNSTEKADGVTEYRQYFLQTICHFATDSICRSSITTLEISRVVMLEIELQRAVQQSYLHNNLIPKGVVLGDTIFHSPNLLKADPEDITSYIMKVKDLNRKVTGVDWEMFLKIILNGTEIKPTAEMEVVALTMFLEKLIATVKKYPQETVQNYICWKVVQYLMSYGSASMRAIQFDYNRKISGMKDEPKLSESCVELAKTAMGFAVTSLYASKYIRNEEMEHAMNLIDNIKVGFRHTLNENGWLDRSTKEQAIKKLNMMGENVAYPPWNTDTKLVNDYYQKLPTFSATEFLKNALGAMKLNFLNAFSRLKGPVDRTNAWPVKNPLVLNAFYYPNLNSFYLVAGMMELPIYSKDNLASLNHGGIGYIIGHEVMHGFDTTGAQYDESGQFKNWWSISSMEQYYERAQCMANQYSVPLDDMPLLKINGQLTLGENIADNGGIKGSYWGYKSAVKDDIRLQGLEDISGDKLFFMSAAQLWCTNTRTEMAESLLTMDTHSPQKYRVNIPFGNSEEFANVFQCNRNTKMNIKDKCVLF